METGCAVEAADIPSNGLIGTCSDILQSGSSCEPACRGGYKLTPDTLDIHGDGVVTDSVQASCSLGVLDVPFCEACAAGRYKPVTSPFGITCADCPEGYTSTPGQSQCTIGLPCTKNLTMLHSPDAFTGVADDVWTLACNPGYEPQGIHMCQPDGSFRGGRCSARKCTDGTAIVDSSVVCAGSFPDVCTYMCHCGFSRVGVHACDIDQTFRGGACAICPPGHASHGIACSQCAPGYEPDVTGCVCGPCQDGTAGANGQCLPCSPGTAPDDFHTICLTCPIGKISPDGITCESCDSNSYVHTNEWGITGLNCIQAEDGMEPYAGKLIKYFI